MLMRFINVFNFAFVVKPLCIEVFELLLSYLLRFLGGCG